MSKIIQGARIISRVSGREDISDFIKTPSWSIKEFDIDANTKIPLNLITKFNKLSGLKITDEEFQKTLPKQINFINHLQKFETSREQKVRKDAKLPMTFDDLISQITNLKPSVIRGEKGTWDPLLLPHLKSKNYYVLRESLYK